MATISSLGVGSSGLDIQSIVTKLVDIEKQPLTALQTQAAVVKTKISAYGEIKSRVSALADAASALRSLTTFNAVTATSSKSASVTATAIGGTAANSFSVTVDQLAKAQSYASAEIAKVNGQSAAVGAGSIKLQIGSWGAGPSYSFTGTPSKEVDITVTATDTLASIASKINGTDSGLSASVINTGSGERLMLRSKATGEAAGFNMVVTDNDGDNGDSAGLSRVLTNGSSTASITQYGSDAKVSVNGSVQVSSSTNTFTDIVSGVTLTLQDGATVGDVSEIKVTQDTSAVQTAINTFVTAYNSLNDLLAETTKYNADTGEAGLLQGDSFAVGIQNAMRGILQSTTSGSTFSRLADIGITQALGGNLTVDSTKLTAALKQPDQVKNLFRIDNAVDTSDGVALKFKKFTDGLLAADGLFKSKESALDRQLKSNSDDQTRLNAKVARIQDQLNRRYSALDTQLTSLTSINNYVTQQIAQWNKSS